MKLLKLVLLAVVAIALALSVTCRAEEMVQATPLERRTASDYLGEHGYLGGTGADSMSLLERISSVAQALKSSLANGTDRSSRQSSSRPTLVHNDDFFF